MEVSITAVACLINPGLTELTEDVAITSVGPRGSLWLWLLQVDDEMVSLFFKLSQ